MARRILTAFALLFAASVAGVVVLWLMDALGAARRMSFDPIAGLFGAAGRGLCWNLRLHKRGGRKKRDEVMADFILSKDEILELGFTKNEKRQRTTR